MLDSSLTKLFGNKITTDIATIGITNLYQFITYFPTNLNSLKVFNPTQIDPKIKYIANVKLLNFELRKSSKPFFLFEFSSEFGNFKAYFFTTAKYIFSQLTINQSYQVILSYKAPFWNVERLAILQPLTVDKFILGKAKIQDWLLPNYPRINGFTSNRFIQLHQKLNPANYDLDLSGLIPNNDLIPQKLSLYQVHHPSSNTEFLEAKKQYLIFKVFLQELTFRYIYTNQKQKLAFAGSLETDFLKQLSTLIPYQLTQSQKTTTWEILQALCQD